METQTTEGTNAGESRDLDAMRLKALAKHLGLDNDGMDDLEASRYDDVAIEYGREEYLVLTDEEADERARKSMRDSLWAFNASFLASYVPALRGDRAQKAWSKVAGELCEDAGPLVEALLGDRLDEALDDAIRADGRGHFLAGYDGGEYDESVDGVTFYIYRTN